MRGFHGFRASARIGLGSGTALSGAVLSLAAICLPGAAQAQAPAKPAPAKPAAEDTGIVVTGTLIRGTQAVGSQTIIVDQKAITEVASSSTNELLTSIPQIGSFNARPEGDPRGLTAVSSIVRPNIRNFPSTNSTSGALTLIMVDGMRLTPVGSNSSSPDPDIVPASVLQGLDIVTDGGSSLYGADAVAGVMNFRTMKKFDGIKIDGNYGFGTTIKGYHTWDGAITAGHSWSSGNAYISVSHTERDSILNSQTPWANGIVYSAAGVAKVTSTTCNTPQPTAMRYVYFNIPNVFTGWTNSTSAGAGPIATGTGCDQVTAGTYLPSLKRTNVFASVSNSFSDSVDLRITGYWMKRDFGLPGYPLGYTSKAPAPVAPVGAPGSAGAPASSPFDIPQGVGFALGPNSSYVNSPQRIGIETWGITPELTVKLNSNWGLRTSLHYGRSNNFTHFPGLNTPQVDTYVTGGQIVPTNIAAASSAVIADITNWETAQDTKHELFLARAIADGSIFALPAGDAKIAIGAEYQFNKDSTRIYTGKLGVLGTLPYASFSRNVKSVFGEIKIPVTHFLELSGSLRYDSYSDFGNTTNPNVGATFKPLSWLKIYGHWGKSYNAPTPLDSLGIGLGRAGQNYSATVRPTVATGKIDNGAGSYFVVLTGGSPAGVKPQTSDGWALGFDANPARGLRFGAEFYSINLANAIGSLNPAVASTYQTNPNLYYYNNELTANGGALYNTIISQLANGAAVNTQTGGAANIAIIVDTRTSNLNAARVEGIDFHINYETDSSVGHWAFGIAGNEATRARITGNGAITNELGHGQPRLALSTFAGWSQGPLSAKLTANYSGASHDNGTDLYGLSEQVDPFTVFNLNLGYNFGASSGRLAGSGLRLVVDNLFEATPQTIRRGNTNNPSYNNWTLGRVIKLGFTAKF